MLFLKDWLELLERSCVMPYLSYINTMYHFGKDFGLL